jgi:DNA helicase-2/ATP-dependent DNA helicase PcrA
MTAAVADCGQAVGARRFPKADVLVDLVSMAVNTQTPLADLVATRRPQFTPLTDEILRVARRYAERKHAQRHGLRPAAQLEDPAGGRAGRALAERFRHLLVDEYQDTNRLQGDVVDLLALDHQNLCVVGDDAQSIYGFRGAHFANILEFEQRYPRARRFALTVNYRSTPQILSLANASIACNVKQFEKALTSVRPEGALPALVPCRDVFQQAAFVAQRVLELRDEGVPLPEIAVLYRAHHHSMEIQFELARRGIPFVVRSGVRFFEASHVKDVLAHLRFARNPGDELALKRCLKVTPGVGTATAEAVWRALSARRRVGNGTVAELTAPDVAGQVPAKGRPGYQALAALLQALDRAPTRDLPGEAIEKVLAAGYEEYLRAEFMNADSRIEDLRQLAEYARGWADTETFLAEIALLSELTAETVSEGETPDEKMVLSSVHQAKGLEWRAVFVVWLADGRFPSAQALKDRDGEEEERRLFYVACTRAKDELYLAYPVVSAPRDRERVVMKASRFLEELPGSRRFASAGSWRGAGAPGWTPRLAAAGRARDPRSPSLFGTPAGGGERRAGGGPAAAPGRAGAGGGPRRGGPGRRRPGRAVLAPRSDAPIHATDRGWPARARSPSSASISAPPTPAWRTCATGSRGWCPPTAAP